MKCPIPNILASIVWLLMLSPSVIKAEWKSPEEASVTYLEYTTEIDVAADGSFVVRNNARIKVNKETAVSDYGTFEFDYLGDIETLKVISAYIENNGVRKKVPQKFIEDKSVASDSTGFDSTRSVMIVFPDVRAGSIVHFKVERQRRRAVLGTHFEYSTAVGASHTLKGPLLKVVSEKELKYDISGPDGYVSVVQKKNGKKNIYTFNLKRDAFFTAVRESDFTKWSEKPYYPVVQLSSYPSWQAVSGLMNDKIGPLISSQLPERFLRFVEIAKKKKGFVAQSDELLIQMIKELRYVGDWRSVENFNVPKSYAEIDKSSFGDCKELSLVYAGMLRSLGYKAQLAMIERGSLSMTPLNIPRSNYFDHVIVRAEDKNGRVHWVDPTNSSALTDTVRPDIAGRPVLVIGASVKELEYTPRVQPQDSIEVTEITRSLLPDGTESVHAVLKIEKLALGKSLEDFRNSSQERFKNVFPMIMADGKDYKLNDFKMNLRDPYIVRGVDFSLEMEIKSVPIGTTAGFGIALESVFTKYDSLNVKDMELGVKIGEVGIKETKMRVKGIRLVGNPPPECEFSSPWIAATQKVSREKDGVFVQTRLETRKVEISNAELKSSAFSDLRKQIRKCQEYRFLIYDYSGS